MSSNRTEFQRDQITRKSVFVRNKRMAPAPPSFQLSQDKSVADDIDGGEMSVATQKISLKTMGIKGNGTIGTSIKTTTSSKVATENKINLCKTKYMTTERPHFLQQPSSIRKGAEKWDNISQDNKLHIQEHDTPISNSAVRPSTLSSTTTPEDDTSMNMLLQLEKQINRMEFDTRVQSKSEVSPTTPVTLTPTTMRKPVQYTGMECLLNTGVSNVATQGGIGYLEISSNNADDDVPAFNRNTDVRQSVGIRTGDRNLPSGVKQCLPVKRTASDTNQMKVVAMAKRSTDTVTDGKKVSPLPPPRTTPSLTTSNSGGKLKSQSKDEKFRPTDVRKFVEDHMKSRKVNTIKFYAILINTLPGEYNSLFPVQR